MHVIIEINVTIVASKCDRAKEKENDNNNSGHEAM